MDEREKNGGNHTCPQRADFSPEPLEEEAAEDDFLEYGREDDRCEEHMEHVDEIHMGIFHVVGGIDFRFG